MGGHAHSDRLERLAGRIREFTPNVPDVCGADLKTKSWLPHRRAIRAEAVLTDQTALETGQRHPDAGLSPRGLLVADLPGLCTGCVARWLGPRIFWLSNTAIVERRRLSFVSSRLGAQLHSGDPRIEGLRTGVLRVDENQEALLVVKGTACESLIRRAVKLFGIPAVDVVISDGGESFETWWNSLVRQCSVDDTSDFISVSPPLPTAGADNPSSGRVAEYPDVPLRDRALFAMGHRVTVLSARSGGHVETLAERHLADPHRRRMPLLVLSPDPGERNDDSTGQESRPDASSRLIDAGAIVWKLAADRTGGVRDDSDETARTDVDRLQEPVAVTGRPSIGAAKNDGPLECPELWLSHWTRAIHGPWPDEDDSAFLDHLLLGDVSRTRTQLLSLVRILRCGMLYGSSRLVSGDQPVVSWTARPLAEFRSLRTWRRHLRRYDFETRGLSVRRSVLESLGAQPVVYLEGEPVAGLDSEVPTHPSGQREEWAAEQEWRLPGNLKLADVDTNDLCVFTDSREEAEIVRCFCSYRVVVVSQACG